MPDIHFTFKKEENQSSTSDETKYVLEISEKKSPQNLYGKKINSLTGIVGKNASGKTTFVRFFNTNFAKDTHIGTGCFAIWKNKNNEYFHKYFLGGSKKITVPKETVCGDIKPLCDPPVKAESKYPTVVFVSNIFDGRLEKEENFNTNSLIKVINKSLNKELKDLLTNTPLKDDEEKLICNKSFNKQMKDFLSKASSNALSKDEKEKLRCNRFIKNGIIETAVIDSALNLLLADAEFSKIMKTELSFMPNALKIEVNDIIEDIFDELSLKNDYEYFRDNYYMNKTRFEKINKDRFTVDERRCSYEKSLTCFAVIVWQIIKKYLINIESKTADFDNYIIKLADNEEPNINAVNILLDCFNDDNCKRDKLDIIKKFLEFSLMTFAYDNAVGSYFYNKLYVKFEDYQKNENALQMCKFALKIEEEFNLWAVRWTYYSPREKKCGYSTGQLMRFRLLLKIYEAIKKDENNSFIIIIDEWDLYLHPEWQRSGIKELITFINAIEKVANCQIIITSNSPFMLSDLPSQNVIFMDEGKTVEKNVKTFGQNIHTLLKDGFFMESTMGEFAKEHINFIIKLLKRDKNGEFKSQEKMLPEVKKHFDINIKKKELYDTIKNYIEIIGEEFLRNKLLYELEECFYPKGELEKLKQQREEITKRINDIEKGDSQ